MPSKERYAKNPEHHRLASSRSYLRCRPKRLAYAKAWRQRCETKKKMEYHWIRYNHRISRQTYLQLREAFGERCAVCGDDQPRKGKKRLCVDHDHNSGSVRGILCFSCNVAIGSAKESPQRLRELADYLERPPTIQIERAAFRKRRSSADIRQLLDQETPR